MKILVLHILLLFLLIVVVGEKSFAQRRTHSRFNFVSNTVYVEVFGSSGYIYNLGYDKIIKIKANNKFAFGMGVQYLHAMTVEYQDVLSFSPQVSYLYGSMHHLEVGVACMIDVINTEMKIPFRIGYRYQPDDGGFFLRASVNPMIESGRIVPWGGVAIGLTM